MRTFSLRWWDRVSMPPAIPGANPAQRERQRQAQLISRFLLVIFGLTLLGTPTILTQTNRLISLTTGVSYLFYIATLFFNRANRTLIAGFCCMIGLVIGIMTPLLFQGAGIDVGTLAIYYLFAIVEIISCALLPPAMVFLVAFLDSAVICLSLTLQPKLPTLQALVQSNLMGVLIPPILMQAVVAAVMFLLISNLLQAIRRADRAEEITKLQREIVSYEQAKAQDKQQLEDALQQIASVHAQVANGNLNARVSLTEGDVLWTVAIPLNNLLSRAQKWKRDSDMLTQLRDANFTPSPGSSFQTAQEGTFLPYQEPSSPYQRP